MTNITNARTPAGGRRLVTAGAVVLVLGVAGVITYLVLASTETPGAASGQGALQGGLIVLSALLVGVGAVMLLTGLLKRQRGRAGTEAPDGGSTPRTLP